MCDVHREPYFNQKMFTNGLNIGLLLWAWVKKSLWRGNTDSLVKKSSGQSVNKEGHTESLFEHERIHHYFEKCVTVNSASYG